MYGSSLIWPRSSGLPSAWLQMAGQTQHMSVRSAHARLRWCETPLLVVHSDGMGTSLSCASPPMCKGFHLQRPCAALTWPCCVRERTSLCRRTLYFLLQAGNRAGSVCHCAAACFGCDSLLRVVRACGLGALACSWSCWSSSWPIAMGRCGAVCPSVCAQLYLHSPGRMRPHGETNPQCGICALVAPCVGVVCWLLPGTYFAEGALL